MIVYDMLNSKIVVKNCQIIARGMISDKYVSDDISQTVFMKLLDNAEHYEDKINTADDLYSIFRSLARKERGTYYKHAARFVDVETPNTTHTTTDYDVSTLINGLPQSRIVEMLYAGYTMTEIAKDQRVSRSTIMDIKQTIRNSLTG